jgi:hypothetical protein
VNLPLIDTLSIPYDAWQVRPATLKEMTASGGPGSVKVKQIAKICNAIDAARYMAEKVTDFYFENYLQNVLQGSSEYKTWQKAMPTKTPPEISHYQKNYEQSDFSEVSSEIIRHGSALSPDQCLFHGGLWMGSDDLTTVRPLSTSLNPQVALRNAEFKAKAYDAGRLDLLVLRAGTAPKVKAFVFKRRGTKFCHESEVLLASGASLKLKSKALIRSDYPVQKLNYPNKLIPIYVLDVEFS